MKNIPLDEEAIYIYNDSDLGYFDFYDISDDKEFSIIPKKEEESDNKK
jgi:hypothetical protein